MHTAGTSLSTLVWKPALALVAAAALVGCGPEAAEAPTAPAQEALETIDPAGYLAGGDELPEEVQLEQLISTQNTNHFILFIRGLDPSYNLTTHNNNTHIPQGCDAYWSSALQFFSNRGWGSRLRTIGIYTKQPSTSCYVNLTNVVPNQAATSTVFQGSNPLTNETSIGALGHRLAWWIYNNYTVRGLTVSLVGHSMGGLVARVAVSGSSKRLGGFPPPLLVKGMVLLGTPNNGASTSYLGGLVGCRQQCAQMNPGSSFLTSLNNSWDNGNSGVQHRLNLIGSNDFVVGDVRSGVFGGTGSGLYFIRPAYDHGNILNDQVTTADADIGWWADRTQAYTLNPPPQFRGQPRSLQWTFNWATAQ